MDKHKKTSSGISAARGQANRNLNLTWLFNLKFKKLLVKTIAIALLFSFSFNTLTYGLATLPASQNPQAKLEILAALQRTQIRYAESEDAIRLLNANSAECLLLSSGKYLVSKEVAQDDLKLLRGIIHEDIEAIMQIIASKDRSRYADIKGLILKYFPPDQDNRLPIDLYLNHTVARAFEWITLVNSGLIQRDRIQSQDKAFIDKIEPIINSNKHNYFTSEFWDQHERGKKIRDAINGGMRFYLVGSEKTPTEIQAAERTPESFNASLASSEEVLRHIKDHAPIGVHVKDISSPDIFDLLFDITSAGRDSVPISDIDIWLKRYVYPSYRGRIVFEISCENSPNYNRYVREEGFAEIGRRSAGFRSDGDEVIVYTYEKIIDKNALGRESGSAKCIVLDCDGVLWGGILEEAGVTGIVINKQYEDFQRKLLELKNSGTMLVLNSKNDIRDVLDVFAQRKDMLLKWTDFAAVSINWRDKASNMRELAEQLNIGLESMVFIDDTPQERALVSELLPEVTVPDMPDSPSEYVAVLDGLEVLKPKGTTTEEDRRRTSLYDAKTEREKLGRQATSRADYLKSLNIRVTAREAVEEDIPRIAQLTQRTNQFNMNRSRYSEDEIRTFLKDPDHRIYILKYSDRFGDAGMVGIMILKKTGDGNMKISAFCQSCRVLDLGLEYAFMRYVASALAASGITRLDGTYWKSDRNGPVKDLYVNMGFDKVGYEQFACDPSKLNLPETPWIRVNEAKHVDPDAAASGTANTLALSTERTGKPDQGGIEIHRNIIKGIPASPGKVRGTVRRIENAAALPKEGSGPCVLLFRYAGPAEMSLFLKAYNTCGVLAVITEHGGATAHMPTVIRGGFNIPCVAGIEDGARSIKDGDDVYVDGSAGTIEILPVGSEPTVTQRSVLARHIDTAELELYFDRELYTKHFSGLPQYGYVVKSFFRDPSSFMSYFDRWPKEACNSVALNCIAAFMLLNTRPGHQVNMGNAVQAIYDKLLAHYCDIFRAELSAEIGSKKKAELSFNRHKIHIILEAMGKYINIGVESTLYSIALEMGNLKDYGLPGVAAQYMPETKEVYLILPEIGRGGFGYVAPAPLYGMYETDTVERCESDREREARASMRESHFPYHEQYRRLAENIELYGGKITGSANYLYAHGNLAADAYSGVRPSIIIDRDKLEYIIPALKDFIQEAPIRDDLKPGPGSNNLPHGRKSWRPRPGEAISRAADPASGLTHKAPSSSFQDSYSAESATVLLSDLIYTQLHDDRYYEIKYDKSRLTASQVDVIEEYARLLQIRSSNPNCVRLRPFSGANGSKESLIAVYCTGKDFKGEGHVDVTIPEGELSDYLLKITGMVNIALASSNIPENLSKDDVDRYRPIMGYIKNQYKAILGEDLIIPDAIEEMLKTITRIVLGLPKSMRMNTGQIEEFNRLAKQALTAA